LDVLLGRVKFCESYQQHQTKIPQFRDCNDVRLREPSIQGDD